MNFEVIMMNLGFVANKRFSISISITSNRFMQACHADSYDFLAHVKLHEPITMSRMNQASLHESVISIIYAEQVII